MKRIFLCSLIFLQFSLGSLLPREIRKITPPNLSGAHLGKQIICHRPMRNGSPYMKVETIGEKIVATNAGHGGSGYTLAPGAVNYVNSTLIKYPEAQDLEKDTPITIVGGGIIGLFTAYDLINKGFLNLTIIAEKFENLTSHNAGGLLAPVSMNNDSEMDVIINNIGFEAYAFYKEIAQGNNKVLPKECAIIVPTYFSNREDSGLEPYVSNHVIKPAIDVTIDFGTGKTHDMVSYDDGIFMDTAILMESLTSYLKPKVTFVQKKINDFDEIETKYIINCTGLGAQELIFDDAFISIQGHLIMLNDQKPENLQHMILVYLKDGLTQTGQEVTRSFYFFPKKLAGSGPNDIGVIGGTFIKGATSETPNVEEFEIMIQGAKEFYGIA